MSSTPSASDKSWRNQLDVPIPRYPWSVVPTPLMHSEFPDEPVWYDTEYTFLSPETREKYKRHGLAQVTACMFPTASLEQLEVVTRNIIFHTVFDDYYELCPAEQMAPIRDHLVGIIRGDEQPHTADIGLFREAAWIRDRCRALGMPQFWLGRLADTYHQYITYGMMEEAPHKLAKRFPTLAYSLAIHDMAIGILPYFVLAELVNGWVLPEPVYQHPLIQRFIGVMQRLIAIQNDLFSLDREIGRDTEVINHILNLHHTQGIPLSEACTQVHAMNDTYTAEAVTLHAAFETVPTFAPHRQQIDQWAVAAETTLTGLNDWYQHGHSGARYAASGGYPEPEYHATPTS